MPRFTARAGCWLLFSAAALHSQTRRAVVVGIDTYRAGTAAPAALSAAAAPQRLPVRGTTTRTKWINLDGAVNDARQMKALLVGRLGFEERNIVVLANEQATAGAILAALKSQLVDKAARGDISLFYFAGHGSQIANKLGTEADGLDETLVPADAPAGAADIRDKELARIYRAAVAKGVALTVIQDTCHSGSAARGIWNARGKSRELPRDGRYVEDPPDRDANGKLLKAPEEEGVLVLSASQDDEPASEVTTDSGAHGLFSFALFHALETSPPNERVDRLFQRVRAVMQSEGALQEPVMAGAGRDAKGLLGLPADSVNTVTAAVTKIEGPNVHLQAGTASGLYPGCELKRSGGGANAPALRIRVAQVTGLNSSVATMLAGESAAVHDGDLFQLDRWVAPEFANLRVYIPKPIALAALEAVAKKARAAAGAAGVKWVEDPTLETPGAVMSWQGASWLLEKNPASEAPIDLGPDPAAARLGQAFKAVKATSIFFLAPIPGELQLRIGAGTARESLVLEDSPAGAHYVLYGRATAKGLEWAWAAPNPTGKDAAKSNPPMAMPLRTDWFPMGPELAAKLTESAAALARVRGWLQLPSPPADVQFPYRLALKNAAGKSITPGDIVEGERFKLWLEAPSAPAGEVAKRWVYVFAIDREGRGTLVFPAKGQGNVSNRMPVTAPGSSAAPVGFPLTSDAFDVEVAPPFGVDTFFLLVSADALPNPEVLDFAGVREGQRGVLDNSPLARLLAKTGNGTRGQQTAVPLNWFLERQAFRSVAKAK